MFDLTYFTECLKSFTSLGWAIISFKIWGMPMTEKHWNEKEQPALALPEVYRVVHKNENKYQLISSPPCLFGKRLAWKISICHNSFFCIPQGLAPATSETQFKGAQTCHALSISLVSMNLIMNIKESGICVYGLMLFQRWWENRYLQAVFSFISLSHQSQEARKNSNMTNKHRFQVLLQNSL